MLVRLYLSIQLTSLIGLISISWAYWKWKHLKKSSQWLYRRVRVVRSLYFPCFWRVCNKYWDYSRMGSNRRQPIEWSDLSLCLCEEPQDLGQFDLYQAVLCSTCCVITFQIDSRGNCVETTAEVPACPNCHCLVRIYWEVLRYAHLWTCVDSWH